jgi:hypothetical protein
LVEVTDEMMRERLKMTRGYTMVLIKKGPSYTMPGAEKIVWEHGRRNFGLRLAGQLAIVCPVRDESEVCGLYIFPAEPSAVRDIMVEDPGVRAGVFTFDIHPIIGFPGDALPS